MYDKYELKMCDSILIVCPMNDQYMPFYLKNKNEYCFNWIDSSTMARQKNKTKTGSSKLKLQYTNSQLRDAIDTVKKIWLCTQQAGRFEFLIRRFALKYLEELP